MFIELRPQFPKLALSAISRFGTSEIDSAESAQSKRRCRVANGVLLDPVIRLKRSQGRDGAQMRHSREGGTYRTDKPPSQDNAAI